MNLKPCPYCGKAGETDQFNFLGVPNWQGLCVDSNCRGGRPSDEGWETEQEAIEAWNTRAQLDYIEGFNAGKKFAELENTSCGVRL